MKKTRRKFIEEMVEKYKHYCRTEESFAVLFVKKYLRASDNKWIDIIDLELGEDTTVENIEFKSVTCELFEKTIKPKYPPKQYFQSDEEYTLICRAITWETAHKDINNQRAQNIQGSKYSLGGTVHRTKNKNYSGYFVKDAPAEIKALAKNLNDRSNPLWKEAAKYISHEPKYFNEYKLNYVKRLNF